MKTNLINQSLVESVFRVAIAEAEEGGEAWQALRSTVRSLADKIEASQKEGTFDKLDFVDWCGCYDVFDDEMPEPVNAPNHASEDCECAHCQEHPICASRNGEACDCHFSQECNNCGVLLSVERWTCPSLEKCGLSCSEDCHKKHFEKVKHW